MTLSPVECWLAAVLLGAAGLVGMATGGTWFWAGWVIEIVSSWYLIQSLTREWVWSDEDDHRKKE